MGCCGLHCVKNALIVIVRVGICLWEPNHFFRINGFAVYYRADFSVGAARIETDTASVEMSSNRLGIFVRFGNFVKVNHFNAERTLVNSAHKVHVKCAETVFCICRFYFFSDRIRAADNDLPTSSDPKQGFGQSFDELEVLVVVTRSVFENLCLKGRNMTVVSLNAYRNILCARFFRRRKKIANNKSHGLELLV